MEKEGKENDSEVGGGYGGVAGCMRGSTVVIVVYTGSVALQGNDMYHLGPGAQ